MWWMVHKNEPSTDIGNDLQYILIIRNKSTIHLRDHRSQNLSAVVCAIIILSCCVILL